ncbi:hypothetical protein IVB22_09240 [Bradyrhizobium sp. 190]|uniref:hypothetical protein n=1 Tax=Bradyrhizobium sp. 190 TaxID=2782658 RepID=UPI001FF91C35|nr:hypothetical protein [Bradyrhizobium sp. 190]MCK1512754.1 hypothetical protein [Bradyrhizobium sp. 190]
MGAKELIVFGKEQDVSKGLLVRFDARRDVAWPIDPQTGTARRSRALAILRKEILTYGLCHARRASFHEDWLPGQWLLAKRSRAPPIMLTARCGRPL